MVASGRRWLSTALETVAIWWRIERTDGVALGFTTHDRDLWFDGLLHRAAPGMVPSAIRLTSDFEADSAEIAGALSHDAISAGELAEGRFDGASVSLGLVDWESGARDLLYNGTIGAVGSEGSGFTAELRSAKDALRRDLTPRTSPTCRAEFCGTGCTLSARRYTHMARISAVASDGAALQLTGGPDPAGLRFGLVRPLDGSATGLWRRIEDIEGGWLHLDRPVDPATAAGTRMQVREGCDHTLETCATRFGNAANFQGEPFLPGNDLLTRYPPAQG